MVLMMNLACAMAQKTGTTGPLSWEYNETSKELTITGNGAMPNYDYGAAPWQEYQEGIETVNVGSGVTSIGNNAFCNCIYMTTLSLPAGMETIGDPGKCGDHLRQCLRKLRQPVLRAVVRGSEEHRGDGFQRL